MDKGKEIIESFNRKGWNFYRRGEIKKGPVKSLLLETPYTILPAIKKKRSEQKIKDFIDKFKVNPQITLPSFKEALENKWNPYLLGRRIIVFTLDEEETTLSPGEAINFVGIELQEKEVRLFTPDKIFISYEIFLKRLSSLPDTADFK